MIKDNIFHIALAILMLTWGAFVFSLPFWSMDEGGVFLQPFALVMFLLGIYPGIVIAHEIERRFL